MPKIKKKPGKDIEIKWIKNPEVPGKLDAPERLTFPEIDIGTATPISEPERILEPAH